MDERTQRTKERQSAIIEILVDQGVIPAEWESAIRQARGPDDFSRLAEAAREGRSPPSDITDRGPSSD